MTKAYDVQVTVRDFDPKKLTQIYTVVRAMWTITEDTNGEDAHGVNFVELSGCGGLSDDDFEDSLAERIRDAVWRVAGRCGVEVVATCLVDLPNNRYSYGVHDYDMDAERLGLKEKLKK